MEQDKARDEINGLLDVLKAMVDKAPAATPEVLPSLALRLHNLAVEMTRTTRTSLPVKRFVCSKRPSHRGPSYFP